MLLKGADRFEWNDRAGYRRIRQMSALIGAIGAELMVALIALLGMRALRELGVPMDRSAALRAGMGSAVAAQLWLLLIGCFLSWQITGGSVEPMRLPELFRAMPLLGTAYWPFSGYAALVLGASSFIHAALLLRALCPEDGDAERCCCLLFCTPIGLTAFLPCGFGIVWAVACAVLCALRHRLRLRIRLGRLPDVPICALLLILTTTLILKWNI